MILIIFLISTFVMLLSIPLLFVSDCGIGRDISLGIISAYIFYLIIEFIPAVVQSYREYSIMAITYRKVQLMLHRLDSLFLEPYKTYVKNKKKKTENGVENSGDNTEQVGHIALDKFYDKDFLIFLDNFDLLQESNAVSFQGHSFRHISFKERLNGLWKECVKYANEALNTSYIEKTPELAYLIQNLISESTIHVYFDLVCEINSNENYSWVLDLKQSNNKAYINTINTIIKIHKIAFSMYDKLKNKKHLIVSEPMFYENKK